MTLHLQIRQKLFNVVLLQTSRQWTVPVPAIEGRQSVSSRNTIRDCALIAAIALGEKSAGISQKASENNDSPVPFGCSPDGIVGFSVTACCNVLLGHLDGRRAVPLRLTRSIRRRPNVAQMR